MSAARWPRFRSVNVALRKELDLYACLRPCKSYTGVKSRFENIDLMIVRENTEDLYAGVEFAGGSPEAKTIEGLGACHLVNQVQIDIENRWFACRLDDNMLLPYLFKQRL